MHVVKVTGLTPRERCYPILRYLLLPELLRNHSMNITSFFRILRKAFLTIDIRSVVDLDLDSQSGSVSRRAKMTHQNRKR
jgi:hypothetical protein